MNKTSILGMAMGAIQERVDYEMGRVLDNIVDPNTRATAKRKITVTLELSPDDTRRTIHVAATAKSALAPTNPIATSLYVTSDQMGEMAVVEMTPQIPGQTSFSGQEQDEPKVLNYIRRQA